MAPHLVEVKIEKLVFDLQLEIFDFVIKTDLDYLENKISFCILY